MGDLINNTTLPVSASRASSPELSVNVIITLYSIIFVVAIIGNGLVILTLIQNKRMRTVTNVFLLNLSFSDLLLAVFCMPFTLVPVVLQNFIFGALMCVLIRYLQAVSVATSCFTLVAISMERYFAIVHPLQSRSWQTLSHAYKIIAVCWLSALVSMSPIAVYTKRLTINAGRHACREMWPTKEGEMAYMVFMDLILLVLPVNIMAFSYGKVISTLWVDIKDNTENEEPPQHIARYRNGVVTNSIEMNAFRKSLDQTEKCGDMRETTAVVRGNNVQMYTEKRHMKMNTTPLRQTNLAKSRAAKLRVIKMLTAVVMEYFLCWTPLFFIQSWIIFDLPSAQNHISPLAVSLTHLFSYVSTCCNPVTYCFMNKKFRDAFLGVFQCCKGAINLRKSSMFRSGDWTSNQNSITRVTSMKNHAGGYERYQDSDEHSDAISR